MTSGVQIPQVPPALVRNFLHAAGTLTRRVLIAVGLFLPAGSAIGLAADSTAAPTLAGEADANSGAQGAAELPILSIELHPSWCYLSGTVSGTKVASELSLAIEEAFPRRCFSSDLEIADHSSGPALTRATTSATAAIDLPLNLDQVPDLLRELSASSGPIRIDWFPESHRLVVRGQAYSRVTVAALAMRLRLATRAGAADGIIFENRIEVVAPPRSLAKSSLALATLIERDFENVELPLLPPIEFQPIYFTHRDATVDRQEMPKLIDALDQISTTHRNGDWPRLVITGYALPRGDQIAEIADGLRRASAVRDNLVALGVPEDRFTVQSVAESESAGLTWRSRRVEISVAPERHANEKLVTSLSPTDH